MKILVTGGAGFIGSHVADAALAAGHDVAILDDFSGGRKVNVPEKAAVFEADIRDASAVLKAMQEFSPEAVSHQAAQASVAVSVREPALDAAINVTGTLNLLEAAREVGVGRFVFASSGGTVYGQIPNGERASPAWKLDPLCPYACSKVAGEHYLRTYQVLHGLEFNVLRYANVYGPRQDPHGEAGVIAIFMERLLRGEPIQINARSETGDDGCYRDYVYVEDIARANVIALEGRCPDSVVNICSGNSTCTLELARAIEKSLSVEAEITFAPLRAGDIEYAVIDPESGLSILESLVDLETGLARTAQWYREQASQAKNV